VSVLPLEIHISNKFMVNIPPGLESWYVTSRNSRHGPGSARIPLPYGPLDLYGDVAGSFAFVGYRHGVMKDGRIVPQDNSLSMLSGETLSRVISLTDSRC
jgi:hypothetical protein